MLMKMMMIAVFFLFRFRFPSTETPGERMQLQLCNCCSPNWILIMTSQLMHTFFHGIVCLCVWEWKRNLSVCLVASGESSPPAFDFNCNCRLSLSHPSEFPVDRLSFIADFLSWSLLSCFLQFYSSSFSNVTFPCPCLKDVSFPILLLKEFVEESFVYWSRKRLTEKERIANIVLYPAIVIAHPSSLSFPEMAFVREKVFNSTWVTFIDCKGSSFCVLRECERLPVEDMGKNKPFSLSRCVSLHSRLLVFLTPREEERPVFLSWSQKLDADDNRPTLGLFLLPLCQYSLWHFVLFSFVCHLSLTLLWQERKERQWRKERKENETRQSSEKGSRRRKNTFIEAEVASSVEENINDISPQHPSLKWERERHFVHCTI